MADLGFEPAWANLRACECNRSANCWHREKQAESHQWRQSQLAVPELWGSHYWVSQRKATKHTHSWDNHSVLSTHLSGKAYSRPSWVCYSNALFHLQSHRAESSRWTRSANSLCTSSASHSAQWERAPRTSLQSEWTNKWPTSQWLTL